MSGVETQLSKSKNKKRKWPARLFVLALIVAVTLTGGLISYNYVVNSIKQVEKVEDISIPEDKRVEFVIPKGSNTSAIADLLKEKSLIKDTLVFTILSKINGYDGMYQSGTHIVSADLTYDQMMRVLTSKPESRTVTFPEGFDYNDIVDRLIQEKVISSREAFNKAANTGKFDYKFLEGLPSRENRLEGYLFPDTYKFDMNATPEEVINIMLRNFDRKFHEEYYKQAQKLGLTVDQVIILASLVEKEAKASEERDLVAGVFFNRLHSKDQTLRKLQSCATLQYIIKRQTGKIKERIVDEDTKINDPYNTYMIQGLPPGPISNPGEASIKAALYPDTEEGYLYFVAKGDGTHQFSKTYKEHQAAIKLYGQYN